jgi:hypothetical protein
MRALFTALTMTMFVLAAAPDVAAQTKSDCSKYSGVEKEACEKMASKRRYH